ILGVCLVLAYVIAVAGVARDRRGESWLPKRVGERDLWFRKAARRLPPFRSPEGAQEWFVRNHPLGRLAPATSVLGLGCFALLLLVPHAGRAGWNPHVILMGFFWGPPLLIGLPLRALVARRAPVNRARAVFLRSLDEGFAYVRPIS